MVRPREGEVLEGKVIISIRCCLPYKKYNWTDKVAHWVRTLVAKPDDLSSIPQSHKVKGENRCGVREVLLHCCGNQPVVFLGN